MVPVSPTAKKSTRGGGAKWRQGAVLIRRPRLARHAGLVSVRAALAEQLREADVRVADAVGPVAHWQRVHGLEAVADPRHEIVLIAHAHGRAPAVAHVLSRPVEGSSVIAWRRAIAAVRVWEKMAGLSRRRHAGFWWRRGGCVAVSRLSVGLTMQSADLAGWHECLGHYMEHVSFLQAIEKFHLGLDAPSSLALITVGAVVSRWQRARAGTGCRGKRSFAWRTIRDYRRCHVDS